MYSLVAPSPFQKHKTPVGVRMSGTTSKKTLSSVNQYLARGTHGSNVVARQHPAR